MEKSANLSRAWVSLSTVDRWRAFRVCHGNVRFPGWALSALDQKPNQEEGRRYGLLKPLIALSEETPAQLSDRGLLLIGVAKRADREDFARVSMSIGQSENSGPAAYSLVAQKLRVP